MHVEHALEIHAPSELVWAVTVDVEHWPDWNPNVTSVERLERGPFGVGSTARIKQPGMPVAIWRVTTLAPPQRFIWETRVYGMRMVGAHEMIPTANGCTSRLSLETTGLLATLLAPLIRRSAARAIESENRGLRDYCQRAAVTQTAV